MARILLQRGHVALVDDDDFGRVQQYRWYAVVFGHQVRVHTARDGIAPRHHTELGRFILKASRDKIVDHINGDCLDNRRCNLRLCSQAENSRNRRVVRLGTKTSRFKGVSLDGRKWRAVITCDGAKHLLGRFDTEEEAARAYDKAAVDLFEQFARTNESMGLFALQRHR